MGRTFVIGDIHGAKKAFEQCLNRSQFDFENDTLICLGDVCDRWPEVYEVFQILLRLKKLIYILGNHDFWALKWLSTEDAEEAWVKQGGEVTLKSLKNKDCKGILKLLKKAKLYYQIENNLFVHGGFNTEVELKSQNEQVFLWDRTLVSKVIEAQQNIKGYKRITGYDNIYLGHTPTLRFNSTFPLRFSEIWMMDTGAGWQGGKLSMMNVETEEVFQSEYVHELYPEYTVGVKS